MRISLFCPAPPESLQGNRVSAERWERILQALGHQVFSDEDAEPDLLLALHARKSYEAIGRFRRRFPGRPIILALTGTDLYQDLPDSPEAQQSIAWADRLVILQPLAVDRIAESQRQKARVIWQSVTPVGDGTRPAPPPWDVCVLGHLRKEKDPLRTALAFRHLPPEIPIRLFQAGQALAPHWVEQARHLMNREPRYRWLGPLPREQARELLARSHLMVISSRLEGGANVVSEAIVEEVPVLASYMPGNVGMLGKEYAGYFPVGDDRALAECLKRVVEEPDFYQTLFDQVRAWKDRFAPRVEEAAWRRLLEELIPPGPARKSTNAHSHQTLE